jgi:hypothetical protein
MDEQKAMKKPLQLMAEIMKTDCGIILRLA